MRRGRWIRSSVAGFALAVGLLAVVYVLVSVVFAMRGLRTHTGALIAWAAFGVAITLASRALRPAVTIATGLVLAAVGVAAVAGLEFPFVNTIEMVRLGGSEFTWVAAAVLLTGGVWETVAQRSPLRSQDADETTSD